MDRVFIIFYYDCAYELGDGLIFSLKIICVIIFFFTFNQTLGIENDLEFSPKLFSERQYYKYWNPYRRVLELRGEPQNFYGQVYYMVLRNNDNRIKSVTKYGKDRIPKETYQLIWSRSGSRSEYKILFHEGGSVIRLDENLYSHQLSNIRPGWVAKFKSKSDGRPKEVSFTDSLGFEYFSYNFNYTIIKDKSKFTEVIESSYFNSEREFVGRHLLFWEKGPFLKMIQYFDSDNNIVKTKEFIQSKSLQEIVRVITNEKGKELERRIIPYMPPDKYAYKYEWTGEKVIDRGIQDLQRLDLALEFYNRAEEALNKANEELDLAKLALIDANKRAQSAEKLMRKAERQADDIELFKLRMDEAKKEAQKAIEEMFDAEREAERARLEAASATATLDAVQKTLEVEVFAKNEAKEAKKEAKEARKRARKKAREAKRVMQDSLFGIGPKSYVTFAYSQPIYRNISLQKHRTRTNYTIGIGRRNMFRIYKTNVDLGLDINWFDFESQNDDYDLQTIAYFLVIEIDPRIAWPWVPNTFETGFRIGGGMLSPGYGITLGGTAVFNLLPTPLTIGIVTQLNWLTDAINDGVESYWVNLGIQVGVNLEDKIPEIFDIELPNIFD